jgi:hypothetical protein
MKSQLIKEKQGQEVTKQHKMTSTNLFFWDLRLFQMPLPKYGCVFIKPLIQLLLIE